MFSSYTELEPEMEVGPYYELEQSERRLAALDFEDREKLGPAGPGLEAGYVGEVVVGIPVEDGMLV